MATKQNSREFANVASVVVTEAVAGTIAFQKLETNISIMEKVAWVINRIEVWDNAQGLINATGDSLDFGLVTSQQVTDLSDMSQAAVIFTGQRYWQLSGTPAVGFWVDMPRRYDFSTLPMGGILVPPNPIYAACKGNSLTGVATVKFRLYYTPLNLSADEYWQLVEATRIVAS